MWLSSQRDLSWNLKGKLESVALCQYAFCSAGRVSSQVHASYHVYIIVIAFDKTENDTVLFQSVPFLFINI
jgi:hypothetical protein